MNIGTWPGTLEGWRFERDGGEGSAAGEENGKGDGEDSRGWTRGAKDRTGDVGLGLEEMVF